MSDFHFEREARTPYSEAYTIDDGTHSLGRVDVHFTASATYATLSIHTSVDDERMQALLVGRLTQGQRPADEAAGHHHGEHGPERAGAVGQDPAELGPDQQSGAERQGGGRVRRPESIGRDGVAHPGRAINQAACIP